MFKDRVLDNIFNCKTNMEMISLIVKVAKTNRFSRNNICEENKMGNVKEENTK